MMAPTKKTQMRGYYLSLFNMQFRDGVQLIQDMFDRKVFELMTENSKLQHENNTLKLKVVTFINSRCLRARRKMNQFAIDYIPVSRR